MLEGGYLDVNKGSASRTGWYSIIGSFMINKSTNTGRIMGKTLWDVTMNLTCMEEQGTEILAENIKKKTSFGKCLLKQKNTTKFTVEK